MIHLGDITKIKGAEIEPVDCITAGSPCQDLSVAGKRAGLDGERSGLFMEQIRIIKEMREHDRNNGRTDEFIRPRYMVWENVPGAFSSNKGEDFRCVLEETAKVAERDAVIPGPPKGKWSKSGAIMGDGWSIAWRVHDAQFWGVPQRRKRIALVADFGGLSAPEILFERKGMSGNIEESGKEGEGAASDAGAGIEETGRCLNGWDVQSKHIQPENGRAESLYSRECRYGGGESYVLQSGGAISFQERAGCAGGGKGILIQNERTGALSTLNNQSVCAFEPGAASRVGGHVYEDGKAGTVRANAGDNQQAVVCIEGNGARESHRGNGFVEGEVMYTLNATEHHAVAYNGSNITCPTNASNPKDGDPCHTLTNDGRNYVVKTVYDWHRQDTRMTELGDVCVTAAAGWGCGGNNMPYVLEEPYNATTGSFMRAGNSGIAETLAARDYKDPQIVCNSVVRRLTPLEGERLQGFPDHWTDIGEWVDTKGKVHKESSDSARYKALGNSIALPFWFYLLRRISAQYERPATLGSLFDGIGGFPLCWERCNGKGTARWASEIEEFPIAVTQHWFG